MRVLHILPVLGAIALLVGCDPQNNYNSEAAKANTAQAEAKANSLHPAEGNYCGSVYLNSDHMTFDANLSLKVLSDNTHSSSSTDPTDTVQVPKLVGKMTFPAIINEGSAAYQTLPDLMHVTGNQYSIAITYGDYNPGTNTINLPFSVPGSTQGNYGALVGTLDGEEFSGNFYSDSSELVGTFTLSKCGGSS